MRKTVSFLIFIILTNFLVAQVIVLDAGHGYCADCTQNCTSNVRSDFEILTALAVAQKLDSLLVSCSNVTTHLTRTTNGCGDFPSLSQRALMSNNWGADRFLSIHCNAGGGTGTETFWCDNSISSNAACESFANETQNQMVNYGFWTDRRCVEDFTYLNFHLGVLHPTNAVGCLNEIGFVDTQTDLDKLLDNTWRNEFALAYYEALQNDLNIQCASIPPFDCTNTVTLSCGVTYSGSASSAVSAVTNYGCNNWTETGPERVHTFTPSVSGELHVSISNFTGDLDVYILGSCDPSDCLGTVSSSSATYSSALAGETYYIVVDADDGSGSAYDILVDCIQATEDVTLTNAQVTPTALESGETTQVSITQNYLGNSPNVPIIRVAYYLSTDCSLDANDILLGDGFTSLNSNTNTQTLNSNLSIPLDTDSGSYFILFQADANNAVAESNENNNLSCVPINIIQSAMPQEDVSITNITISPQNVAAGGNFSISLNHLYIGSQSTIDLADVAVGYFLSTDCDFDANDIQLGVDVSDLGNNNSSITEQNTLSIPSNTNPGTYYLIFVADVFNNVTETNENNNTTCIPITITTGTVGIANLDFQEKVRIFPNPSDGIVYVKNTSGISIESYRIFNVTGKLVSLSKKYVNSIDVSNLKSGYYFIELSNKNNEKATYKLLKK